MLHNVFFRVRDSRCVTICMLINIKNTHSGTFAPHVATLAVVRVYDRMQSRSAAIMIQFAKHTKVRAR